jgi:hypothetical protein
MTKIGILYSNNTKQELSCSSVFVTKRITSNQIFQKI